jgi:hypothetical protein
LRAILGAQSIQYNILNSIIDVRWTIRAEEKISVLGGGRMSTSQELEESAIRILGANLGLAYHHMYSEIAFLKIKWSEYKKIYLVSNDQVKFLNDYAPFYFSMNQKIMINDILLHIAKLTDKEETFGHKNLSIRNLESLLPVDKHKNEISNGIEKAMQESVFLKDWRKKYLAHYDFYVMTNQNNNILNEISLDEIEKAINSLWDIIISISYLYFQSVLGVDIIEPLGGAFVFIKKLKGEYGKPVFT